jgi:hypothetical protein
LAISFRFGGKQHLMAFGVYPEISLADARKKEEASWLLLVSILVSISVL